MRLITNIYIDTAPFTDEEPIYEKLELFDFESIEVTSSIQEVRDIGSIFTDFSQQFTIPASKTNNRILRHFYNLYLTDGYDARVKRAAFINLNGITFRDGYIRLSEANIKNGRPFSYSLTFFGAIVNLKDILGDDELKDLTSLSQYDHDYNVQTVYSGFNVGLAVNPNYGQQGQEDKVVESTDRDLIYPAISADTKWSYNSTAATPPEEFKQGFNANIYGTNPAWGIDYIQLKPAIKVKKIIEAIEDKYESIRFSDDFFSNTDFNELYLLLHAKKGILSDVGSGLAEDLSLSLSTGQQGDFNLTSGTNVLPITTWTRTDLGKLYTKKTLLSVSIKALSTLGSGNYTVKVVDSIDGTLLEASYSGEGDFNTLSTILQSDNEREWQIRVVISSNNELSQFELNVDLEDNEESVIIRDDFEQNPPVVINTETNASYASKINTFLDNVVIRDQVPKITVINFLKGIFNAFNLTAYVEDSIIVVKTLDNFYADGLDRDLSKELDISDINVKRSELFSNINFEFQEPKTFGVINQNEVANDDFGNLQFQGTVNGRNGNLVFDGKKYEIKLPFEKMLFERLSDEKDLTLSRPPFGYGWLVNKDENPTITKPVIFFNVSTPVNTTDYPINFIGINGSLPRYNRPSNTSSTESTSIHFGAEIDEFTSNLVTDSLFKKYYDKYISNLFAKTTRIVKYTAIMKLNTILNYEMNDRVTINGNPYRFNSIRTNLSTGKSEIELITDFALADTIAPTVPTNLSVSSSSDSSLNVSWTASTDNVGVTGYELYLDGVLSLVVNGNTTTTIIGSLQSNTTYDVELLAFDAAGNKSDKTPIVSGTTLITDNDPPTVPAGLVYIDRQADEIVFRFDGSVDIGTGVKGYNIWLDQVLLQETIEPPYTIVSNKIEYLLGGVPEQQTSTLSLQAFDFAGNESALSPQITIPTV